MHDHLHLLSVCSGIGGLDLAVCRVLGARPVGYVEREVFAATALMERMAEPPLAPAPVWDDLQSFPGELFRGRVDVIAGGIPCQPYSSAGTRGGRRDDRDLLDVFLDTVRTVGPRIVILENVRAFAAQGGLARLLHGLACLGFDAEWAAVRASDAGAPHRRDRLFVLAYADGEGLEGGLPGELARRAAAAVEAGAPMPRALAHGDRGGLEGVGEPDGGGLEGSPGDVPDRRGDHWRLPWPPGPDGDWDGVPDHHRPATEPGVRGMADGTPSLVDYAQVMRVDRIRALGNAVVPQQAEAALLHLIRQSHVDA